MLPVQLLVEGRDEEKFFEEFLKFLKIENIVHIESFKGKYKLRDFLQAFIMRRGFPEAVKRIGIVQDADNNFSSAFESVCNSLKYAKLSAPKSPEVFTSSKPSVGVMILPGKNQTGMLETLLCKTISGTEINECIDKFFECIKDEAKIQVKHVEKARAHVFIATRSKPLVQVGLATRIGYWDLNHEEFNDVRRFLRELVTLDDD